MAQENNIKKKAMGGVIWTFAELILNQGVQFLIQIALARLLLPSEFGLIGMITVVVAISNTFIDAGFTNALIREKEPSQKDYSTVFYFNLIAAIIIYCAIFIFAKNISVFFGQVQLADILKVLSVTIIINAFGSIQRTILTRKLNFKKLMIINLTSSIISGIVAVILALRGYGVWSLVIRMLIMQAMQSILLCTFNRWIPSLVFSMKSFNRLFTFGWKLLVSAIIETVYQNIYYLIIGKVYNDTELGYYTNAQKLRDMVSGSITSAVQKVSYPVLSSMNNEKQNLGLAYKKIIKLSVYITFPVMIGFLAISSSFILLAFGEKWSASIVIFKILCVAGALYPLHAINLNIIQVKGRSDLFLRLEILKKIVGFSIIAIVIFFNGGIIALVSTSIISSVIAYFINSYFSGSLVNYSTFAQIKDIKKIALATVIMGLITYFSASLIPNILIIKLSIQIIVGIASYIILSKILKIEEFNYLLDMINPIIKKIKNKVIRKA